MRKSPHFQGIAGAPDGAVEAGRGDVDPGQARGPPPQGTAELAICPYADDFAVLVDGTGQDTEALREQIADVLATLGLHPATIRKLVRGGTRTVSQRLRDAIAELYDAWWDKRAPGRTRFERAAATNARKRAMTGDWCAAAALDDDQLDIPGYRPEYGWKPATGTGVAPDIYVPVRRHRRRKGE